MDVPSSLATLYTFPHYEDHYTPSAKTFNDQGVVSAPHINGSYLFFPDFIIQVEDSYDIIFSYRSLGASYKGPIDYI